MKSRLIIALAIGALVTTVFLLLEPPTDYAFLSWELPGVTAAYLFWGMVGGPVFMGIAVAWTVNTIVYGAVVLAVLTLIKPLTSSLPKMVA